MTKVLVTEQYLQDAADAIRSKLSAVIPHRLGGFFGETYGDNVSTLSVSLSGTVGEDAVLIVMHRNSITVNGDMELVYSVRNERVSSGGTQQWVSIYRKTLESEQESITVTQASAARMCACTVYLGHNVAIGTPTTLDSTGGSHDYAVPTSDSLRLVVLNRPYCNTSSSVDVSVSPDTLATLPNAVSSISAQVRLMAAFVERGASVTFHTNDVVSQPATSQELYLLNLSPTSAQSSQSFRLKDMAQAIASISGDGGGSSPSPSSSNVIVGTDAPSSDVGAVGSVYVQAQAIDRSSQATRSYTLNIIHALRGSSELTYAGATELDLVFDDGNGGEESIRDMPGFTYSGKNGSNGSWNIGNMFNNNLSDYAEANPTPLYVYMSATVPAGYEPKTLRVIQRTSGYTTDVWKDFTLVETIDGVSDTVLEESVGVSDWAGAGNWTEFGLTTHTEPQIIATYIKTDSTTWTETSIINVTPTYAFIRCLYSAGSTVTCTDGTLTLTSDASGDYTFAVPSAGTWTLSDGTDTSSVTVSDYGTVTSVTISQ